jgi:hypothetical protein
MKTCKQWNSLLRSQRLVSGKIAPIFAFSWKLSLELAANPVRPADQIARFAHVERGELVARDLFTTYVQPQLTAARDVQLLAAPETSGDVEE